MSYLVINCQLKLNYKCESLNLYRYFEIANRLISKFDVVVLEYIPWQENIQANELAQNTYGYKIIRKHFHKIIEGQRAIL